jgi:hypothetical protein
MIFQGDDAGHFQASLTRHRCGRVCVLGVSGCVVVRCGFPDPRRGSPRDVDDDPDRHVQHHHSEAMPMRSSPD